VHKISFLPFKEVKRSRQAECSREEGLGDSPDYGTTQHAHAQKKAKRGSQAGHSGETRAYCVFAI
jgi:hypothetical protein